MKPATAPTIAPVVVKPRVLTPKQWAAIEALWESGDVIYDDLVAKYGKSSSTFERHFKSRGIIKGSKREETKKLVAAELSKVTVNEATVMALRIKETKEQHYKMASGLAQLVWAEVLKTKQDGVPVAVAMNNLKALDAAMNVIKKAQDARFTVLGLDKPDAIDPDELPELVIAELTAEQIKELRDRDVADMDALPVNQNVVQGDPDDDVVDEGGDE